jgi:hypothetical protein
MIHSSKRDLTRQEAKLELNKEDSGSTPPAEGRRNHASAFTGHSGLEEIESCFHHLALNSFCLFCRVQF